MLIKMDKLSINITMQSLRYSKLNHCFLNMQRNNREIEEILLFDLQHTSVLKAQPRQQQHIYNIHLPVCTSLCMLGPR